MFRPVHPALMYLRLRSQRPIYKVHFLFKNVGQFVHRHPPDAMAGTHAGPGAGPVCPPRPGPDGACCAALDHPPRQRTGHSRRCRPPPPAPGPRRQLGPGPGPPHLTLRHTGGAAADQRHRFTPPCPTRSGRSTAATEPGNTSPSMSSVGPLGSYWHMAAVSNCASGTGARWARVVR